MIDNKIDFKNCQKCNGACCRYVAMEIDVPETIEDFSDIRWFVAHKNIAVYIEEDGTWNIEFLTPCKYLTEDGKCSIHENCVEKTIKRPAICKEFSVEDCPHHNEYSELYRFEKIEDVDEYIEKIFNKGLHTIATKDD